MYSSCSRGGELCTTFMRASIYMNYLKLFCLHRRIFTLSIYLSSHLYQHGLMDIYFILCATTQYYFIYLIFQIVPALAIQNSFALTVKSFWYTPFIILSMSLLFGTARCSRLILYTFWFIPIISHFSEESWFHVLENGIRNWNLGMLYACCYWGIVSSRPSQLTEKENICVYSNLRIYTYL